MRLAYCDDEEIQLEYMQQLAERWAEQAGVSLTYYAYKSAEELLFENAEEYPFDLLILDIDMQGMPSMDVMPSMNGMELAREIRAKDTDIPILFLTNKREYVFQGYEVQALRYLLKPISEKELFPLLDEVCASAREGVKSLIVSADGECCKIAVPDILYLEADGHYVKIHTVKRDYMVKRTFTELAGEMAEGFVYTHRSYLVHLLHVERVQRTECILSDGSSVPVSRNSYKAVNEAFIGYWKDR